MDRVVEIPPRTALRVVVVAAVAVAVALLDAATAARMDASVFYFIPIVLACTWFGTWGLLALPVAVVLSVEIEIAESPYGPNVATDLARTLSFALIAGLTLLARSRYRQLLEAKREQEAQRRDAESRGNRLEALYRVATAANASHASEEFLALFLEEVARLFPRVCAAVVLEEEEGVLVIRASYGPVPEEAIGDRILVGEGVAGRVVALGRPLVLQGMQLSPEDLASPLLRQLRPVAVAGIPLVLHGDVIGALVILGGEGAEFTSEDTRVLQSMAAEAALVLESLNLYQSLLQTNQALRERQERLDEQLRLAREVQEAILSVCPRVLRAGPLEIASFHASAWEVGGDFLRIVPQDGGVGFFVGDVMGKGVAAALLMTMMTAALTGSAARAEDPSAVLREANQVLTLNVADPEWSGFVTVFYAFVDTATLRMRYASAGHSPPILVHTDGRAEELLAQGIPLGISTKLPYPATDANLRPGDRLVLYTDGITEARDAAGELFGSERLQQVILANREASAEDLQDAVVGAVRHFTGSSMAAADDMALLVVAVSEA